MLKYTIAGKQKGFDEQLRHCPTCDDGKKFQEERYKTDTLCKPHFERICAECLSKYKIPYIDLGYNVEAYPGREINRQQLVNWTSLIDDGSLDNDNQAFHTIRIAEEMNQMTQGMISDGIPVEEMRSQYAETGECPSHMWLPSKPFKTFEGQFVLEACPVCKLGRIVHNGQMYQDEIMNLVRYVAQMGIVAEYEANQKALVGNIEATTKTINELPSFELKQELPSFEMEIPVF